MTYYSIQPDVKCNYKIYQLQNAEDMWERDPIWGYSVWFQTRKVDYRLYFSLVGSSKAKKKKYRIWVAFCDLQKAFESIDREILYKKLEYSGFGGKVLQLVLSMYFYDNVVIKLSRGLSTPQWVTRRVKQGFTLSPHLFALYCWIGNSPTRDKARDWYWRSTADRAVFSGRSDTYI